MELRVTAHSSNYTVKAGYKSYQNLTALKTMQKKYNAKNLEKIEGNTMPEKQFNYFKLIADTYLIYNEFYTELVKQGFASDNHDVRFLNIYMPDWFLVNDYKDPECDYPWGRYKIEAFAPQNIANLFDKKIMTEKQIQKLIKEKQIIVRAIYIDSQDNLAVFNIDKSNPKHEKDFPIPNLPCLDLHNIRKNDYLLYNNIYPNLFSQFLQQITFNTLQKDIRDTAQDIKLYGTKQLQQDQIKLKKLLMQIKNTKEALKEVNENEETEENLK